MYRFVDQNCTERFVGMIHALACFAALANRWPYTLIPTAEEAARKERDAAAWGYGERYTGYCGD